jgi:hypothetical protein
MKSALLKKIKGLRGRGKVIGLAAGGVLTVGIIVSIVALSPNKVEFASSAVGGVTSTPTAEPSLAPDEAPIPDLGTLDDQEAEVPTEEVPLEEGDGGVGGGVSEEPAGRDSSNDLPPSINPNVVDPATGNAALPESNLSKEQLAAEIAASDAQQAASAAGPVQPGHAIAKRSADEALPPVKLTGAAIIDTTDGLIDNFGGDLEYEQDIGQISVTKSSCLLDWAMTSLPGSAGRGEAYVTNVCGQTAAVIVGGYSVSGRDMIIRALRSPEHAPLKGVIFGAKALNYAAVASTDGEAVMIVVTR